MKDKEINSLDRGDVNTIPYLHPNNISNDSVLYQMLSQIVQNQVKPFL